jgi:alpha-tubulin suppressor-like RCC1 family protein
MCRQITDYIGIAASDWHSVALKADGSLAAWGHNGFGQCNVPAGSDYIDIAGGGWHNLVLKADGSLAAWGLNNFGQCDVPAGDFIAIAAGGWHSLALTPEPATVLLLGMGGLALLRKRRT